MKKLFLVLVILPLAALTAQATSYPSNEIIQQEATHIARNLVGQLKLNELEYIKVRELTVQRILALNDIADYYQYDKAMLQRKSEAAEIAYEERLRYILNATQLENYLTLHGPE